MEPQLSGRHPPDSEQVMSALALIVRMQKETRHLRPGTLSDEALLLIGRKHNGERP